MSRFEFLAKPKVKFSISEKATKICTIVLMVWTFTEFGPRFLCQTIFFLHVVPVTYFLWAKS